MGILHVLAELKQPSLITLGDVSLRVGESDRDAAVALLAFMDEHINEGETTYSQVENLLVLNFLEAIKDAINGCSPIPTIMEDRKVRMMLDCLWWFRFLVASRPEDDDAKLRTGEGKAVGEI